jgi:methyl-accepting chemotaxis protein
MKLSNLKIGTRLSGAFAVLLVLLGIMLLSALWQLERVAAAKADMAKANHQAKLASAWREGITTNSVRTLARAKSTDQADEQALDNEMKTVSAQLSKVQDELEGLITSAEGKAKLQVVADQRKIYSAVRTDIFKRKAEQGMSAQLNADVDNKLLPELKKYLAAVEEVVAFEDASFNAANQRIDEVVASSETILVVLGVLALACGIALGVLLTRSITRPLAHAVGLAQQVASGDLTADIRVSSKDEVGVLLSALKHMNESLLKTVSEVRSGTETIVTASQQIAAGNLDLSSRTEQQASSLEETASSMMELTSTVRQNADNARQANTLAQDASGIAMRGGQVVSQVVETMASINTSSKKIADIIAVIDGIAFQTNILALNAAVEAARAGEQGRGFAVVASEVRNLAQRSAAAAKEIRGLITDSVGKVEMGGQLVEQAGATMQEIVQGISRVTHIMADIANASAEQSLGIEQVNAAITQMDDVTQQNAALVEEAAAAAGSLENQAASLARLVSSFKLDSGHGDSVRGAPAAHAGTPVSGLPQLALR